jgi:molybdopterin biosynthesis enzyme
MTPARVVLLPTGDEVVDGIIIDTNTPALAALVQARWPTAAIVAHQPVRDRQADLRDAIQACDADLLIASGGSGGGKAFVPELAEDCTHRALLAALRDTATRQIWGQNGHLWSQLVAGRLGRLHAFNVPGPQVEAVAAATAALDLLADAPWNAAAVVTATATAVLACYPPSRAHLR